MRLKLYVNKTLAWNGKSTLSEIQIPIESPIPCASLPPWPETRTQKCLRESALKSSASRHNDHA